MLSEEMKSARILVVDDEKANVTLLTRILFRAGYEQMQGTTDSRDVLKSLDLFNPTSFSSICTCRTSTDSMFCGSSPHI